MNLVCFSGLFKNKLLFKYCKISVLFKYCKISKLIAYVIESCSIKYIIFLKDSAVKQTVIYVVKQTSISNSECSTFSGGLCQGLPEGDES